MGQKKTDTSSLVVPIFSSPLPFFSSLPSTLAPCLADSAAAVKRRSHRCSGSVDDETGSTSWGGCCSSSARGELAGAPAAPMARAAQPLALWAVEAAAAPVTTTTQAGPFSTPSSPSTVMARATFLDPAGPQSAAFLDPAGSDRPTFGAPLVDVVEVVDEGGGLGDAVHREHRGRGVGARPRGGGSERQEDGCHGGGSGTGGEGHESAPALRASLTATTHPSRWDMIGGIETPYFPFPYSFP